jgi:ABC-type transporter Mla MlaB component
VAAADSSPGAPPGSPLPPRPSTIVLVLGDALDPADALALARHLPCGDGLGLVICDLRDVVHPDVGTVDALARLQLAARRGGGEVRLRHASPRLRELLTLIGLAEVLPPQPDSAVEGFEAGGQAEDREQVRGVEEERDPGDLPL